MVSPEIPASLRARYPHLSPVVAQILYNRGVLNGDSATVDRFLNPRWDSGLHDPFLLADMAPAVERILAAIDRNEPIGVFGHYDADGITATTLLTETLLSLGAQAIPYMPNRSDDYGVNAPGIAALAARGVRLLVSVDCGIRSFDAPAVAAGHGMECIFTDHHTVLREEGADVLPKALAVINPLRADCPYPFKALAGGGVAFKLAHARLRAHARRRGAEEGHFAKWRLDLVCLGTVADVVDVTDENRTLVHLGLEIIRKARRPGVRALLGVAGTNINRLDADAIGFQLAPRINAAARLESAWTSMDLFRAKDLAQATPIAQRLDALNRERQRLTAQAMEDVLAQYGETLGQRKAIVAVGHWAPGIIGLVAGKLSEGYHRPAAVIEMGAGEELHGSARSPAGFHISDALGLCGDLLSRYGGHAQAAGFSLPAANLDAFSERLEAVAEAQMTEEQLEPTLAIDLLLEPEQVNEALLAAVATLEPCRPGNTAPVFPLRPASLSGVETFGAAGQHLRLSIAGGGRPLKAVGWRLGPLSEHLQSGNRVDIAFALKQDPYSGMSLQILDLGAAN